METGLVPMICHPWGGCQRGGHWGQVLGESRPSLPASLLRRGLKETFLLDSLFVY